MDDKSMALYFITEQIHENIDDVYETASEGDVDGAMKNIDEAIKNLKDLKNNLIIKDEV